jgi:branched-chain amino acid transport system ATP-binding protein
VVVRRLAPALERIANSGVGVLLIEQFTSLALGIADYAYVLVRGRIQLEDDASSLRSDPGKVASAYRVGDRATVMSGDAGAAPSAQPAQR